MHDAAKSVNPDILVLCHGGPIAEPDDAAYVLTHTTGVVGFFGASSMERLPTEIAISETLKRFKEIQV
jgi:predicted TIM-barrel enzyme